MTRVAIGDLWLAGTALAFGPFALRRTWQAATLVVRRRRRAARLRELAQHGRPPHPGCHHCGYDVPPVVGPQCPRCGRRY